jgi:hypothetical protein
MKDFANKLKDAKSLNALSGGLDQYIDYDVMDDDNHKVGKLNSLWVDREGHPQFLGIRTGRMFGKTHVVPTEAAKVNESMHSVRLPFSGDTIRCAPVFEADKGLGGADGQEVYRYFQIKQPAAAEARLDPASRPCSPPYVKVPSAEACNTPLTSPKTERSSRISKSD